MVRNGLIFSLYCSFLQILSAQSYVFNPHKAGDNLFAGGIDTPRFQFVDIDGDLDHDLFIFDRDGKLWFYRNMNGTLKLEPNATFGIEVGSWFRFVDIDGDGDLDCMTNGSFSEVSLFKNIGSTTSPQFQRTIAALLDTSGTELFSERFSIPTFADIDDDGDLDFFTGGSNGSITYYRNIGTKNSPRFTFITSVYQGINIQGGPGTLPKPLHGASGIEFFDVDSNGVLDLFWGDYFNPSLYVLQNSGTKQNAVITLVDSTYPNEAVIKTPGFNYPQHIDADNNGTIDLMIGCVYANADYNTFLFYKNIGTNAKPFYFLQTKNYIPMIDVGSRSSVAASDFDSDGDIDLCVSSGGGLIAVFQNTGTPSSPKYSSIPTSSFTLNGEFNLTVAAGDLNGDGIPDLLVGTYENGVKAYINTSSSGNISFVQQQHPVDAFAPGQSAAPSIADIDGDGKIDVVIGNSGGQLWFLKNIGTNVSPVYTSMLNFNSIDVGNDAIPSINDIENDGLLDILIGNSDGNIWHYQQKSKASTEFMFIEQHYGNIDMRTQSAPAIADIDADGDKDLLIGNGKGGIFFYENTAPSSIQNAGTAIPATIMFLQNYPNPFNPSTTIEFELSSSENVRLSIVDVLGKEMAVLLQEHTPAGKYSVVYHADGLAGGVYFCRLSAGRYVDTKKIILIK